MGIDIKESRIPILPECKILCDQYALDPLATIASGALLIGCPSSAAPAIVRELLAAGIAAPVIGEETEPGEGVTIRARMGMVPTLSLSLSATESPSCSPPNNEPSPCPMLSLQRYPDGPIPFCCTFFLTVALVLLIFAQRPVAPRGEGLLPVGT